MKTISHTIKSLQTQYISLKDYLRLFGITENLKHHFYTSQYRLFEKKKFTI
jgi:hypothetical protein